MDKFIEIPFVSAEVPKWLDFIGKVAKNAKN